MSPSRLPALAGAAVSATPIAMPFVALAGRQRPGAASPLAGMAQRCREARDAWAQADDDLENAIYDIDDRIKADHATYTVRFHPSYCRRFERFTFGPFNVAEHDTALARIEAEYQAEVGKIGKILFSGSADAVRTRLDSWLVERKVEVTAARSAYARLHEEFDLDRMKAVAKAADDEAEESRRALFDYQPRNLAEVAEKATILLEIGHHAEGWTDHRVEQLLVSLGGKAVTA